MFQQSIEQKLQAKQPHSIGEEEAFRSAVVIPLVQIENEWHVLFQVRAFSMRKQPGDISFPGGKIDDTDASPKAAALREVSEELGIDANKVEILGELSPFITSPAFVVYPFVAVLPYEDVHDFNKDEVEEIFTVPLNWLLEHEQYRHLVPFEPRPGDDFPYEKIMNGEGYKWRSSAFEEWFYEYGNYTIWGLTARILKYFIHLMNK